MGVMEDEIEIKHIMEKAKIGSRWLDVDHVYVPLGVTMNMNQLKELEKSCIEKYTKQLDVEAEFVYSYISTEPELSLWVYITIKREEQETAD